eukprot:XP_010646638.1 PREDICTED: protein transport protein sec31-like [Vitis vinifera]
MAKTRGGHSASPSSPTPRPHRAAMGAAASPPVQAPAIPPSEGEAPSQRRYPTRRPPTDLVPPVDQATSPVSRPPAKRTKFSGPGEPSHAPQPEPPTEDSRIPADIPLETVIRRPMIAGPPIEAYFAPEGAPAVPARPELPRDDQLPQAQQDEILTETTPPTPAAPTSVHMPEAIHSTSPITQGAPPVVPATPAPPPSSEPTVTIQQHLSMQTPLGHDKFAPSEPLVPDEESLPAEQPIPEEEIRAEPSHDPTHI